MFQEGACILSGAESTFVYCKVQGGWKTSCQCCDVLHSSSSATFRQDLLRPSIVDFFSCIRSMSNATMLSLQPPFSAEEYSVRLASVQQSMVKEQLDILIITEPENIYYMTGYQTVGAPEVQALMVAKDGNMYFLTRKLEVTNAYRSNLKDKVEVYADYESGIHKLCSVLLQNSPDAKVAGLEFKSRRLTSEQRHLLETTLPYSFVDCSNLIPRLRLIKSRAEIAIMKRAAEICTSGVKAGLASKVHMTESQIAGNVYKAMCDQGGEYPAYPPFICAGRNGCIGHYTGSGHTTLREGEVLFLEIGGCFERYHAAMMRTCFVGTKLPSVLAKVEAAILKAMETASALLKPGAIAKDVDKAARQVLEEVPGGNVASFWLFNWHWILH